MSDPAKTPEEIEDVLASIRRLVSDHSSGPDGTMQPHDAVSETVVEPEAAQAPAQPEALVLTPSFRVTDPEDPWVPVAVSEPETETVPEPVVVATVPVEVDEDLVAELLTAQAAPSEQDADWQPDDRMVRFDAVGEEAGEADEPTAEDWPDAPEEGPTEEEIADLIRLDGTAGGAADFESETGDDNWPESGAEAALLTLVARREPAVEQAEAVATEAEDTLVMTEDDGADAVEDEAEVEPEDAAPGDEPHDDSDHSEPSEDEAVGDDDSAAALQSEEQEDPQQNLNDEAGAEDSGDAHVTPIFSRRNAENATESTTEDAGDAPVEDLGDTPSPFTFPETEDGVLDEETLREIIVDVVREELQGVLGQRITRNVRKMVRREIRLALAAEDLE